MNRSDLIQLGAPRTYPAVSILAPTHRHAPENRQDPIRVRNLLAEAVKVLEADLGKREAALVLEQLDLGIAEIDFEHTLDGVAVYATADEHHTFLLPYTVPERLVIDSSFATRDLVLALNRSYRYLVLVLSEQPTRLFRATLDTLEEVSSHGFPMEMELPAGATEEPRDFGQRASAHRDERHRQFFRQVDAALGDVIAGERLPVIVAGVERYQAFYAEITAHAPLLAGRVEGSHDRTPAHELAKLVLPVAKAHFAAQRAEVLEQLDRSIGQRRYASGIDEIRTLALAGRGQHLLVEQGYRQSARIVDEHVVPLDEPDAVGEDVVADVVDEVIETVLAQGGEVTFFDDGVLEAHGRIALITRY